MKEIALPTLVLGILITASTGFLKAQEVDKAAALAAGFKTGAFEISNYNTACYFSLAGNKKLALIYLEKAIKDGFNRPKAMLEDSDLFPLHNEAEWPFLVKLVQQNELNEKTGKNMFFNQSGFWDSKFFQTPYRENISEEEK